MTQNNWFDLQSKDKSPTQLALSRRDALNAAKAFGRVRLDAEACAFEGYGIVVSVHRVNGACLIVKLDSEDEAIAFVDEANGETDADVLETARAYGEYLHNVRTGRRPQEEFGKKEE